MLTVYCHLPDWGPGSWVCQCQNCDWCHSWPSPGSYLHNQNVCLGFICFDMVLGRRKCFTPVCPSDRPLSRIFQKIRLAEPYFRLISGLAEFLRKLRNSAKNTPNTTNSANKTDKLRQSNSKYKQHSKGV